MQLLETAAVANSHRKRIVVPILVRGALSLSAIAVAREVADMLIGAAPGYEAAINTLIGLGLAVLISALLWPAFNKRPGPGAGSEKQRQ